MLKMIFAMAENYVIGNARTMPWPQILEDMKFFKEQTSGKIVVMGRKTFESLGSKPLPNRGNYVVSSHKIENKDVKTISSNVKEIVLKLAKENDVFIIGGKTLYDMFYEYANEIHVTKIYKEYQGDTIIDFKKYVKNREEICLKKRFKTKSGIEIVHQKYV